MTVEARASVTPPALSGLVLIAEDSPINRTVAQLMVAETGCGVDFADNGIKALECLAARDYDLVFMDVHMPEMDGLEATRRIRALQAEGERKCIPIIALTANTMPGDLEKCLAIGMDDYVSKPFDRRKIWAVLEKWLGARVSATRPGSDAQTDRPAEMGAAPQAYPEVRRRDGEAIDQRALDEIRALAVGEDAGILEELISLYLEDAPPLISAIAKALENGDCEKTRAAAHRLKSNSANLGAIHVSQLCAQLEASARRGMLSEAPGMLKSIRIEYEKARTALMLEKGGRAA